MRPMDPRTDKIARHILLGHLKRDLMYIKFNELQLVHLQALRDEVTAEMKKLEKEPNAK